MEEFAKTKRQFFSTFLRLPNGIPSHDTFNRLFARLDSVSFGECFMRRPEKRHGKSSSALLQPFEMGESF